MKKTPSEIAWEVKRYLSIEGVTMAEAAARRVLDWLFLDNERTKIGGMDDAPMVDG